MAQHLVDTKRVKVRVLLLHIKKYEIINSHIFQYCILSSTSVKFLCYFRGNYHFSVNFEICEFLLRTKVTNVHFLYPLVILALLSHLNIRLYGSVALFLYKKLHTSLPFVSSTGSILMFLMVLISTL